MKTATEVPKGMGAVFKFQKQPAGWMRPVSQSLPAPASGGAAVLAEDTLALTARLTVWSVDNVGHKLFLTHLQ